MALKDDTEDDLVATLGLLSDEMMATSSMILSSATCNDARFSNDGVT